MGSNGLVFAGQGAQFVGMGKDLAEAYPECRALFDRADEALGFSLSKICFEGPVEELTKTQYCQPAIFVTSMACWKAFRLEAGSVAFGCVGGLSLGEWSALHMAGALTYEDTLRVLEARGRFMQEACEERPGGMVSVMGLPVAKLTEVCAATGAEIANLNSEDQIVLSGSREAIAAAEKAAVAAGAKRTVTLNVAGAYHSSLMASAARRLESFLANIAISAPTLPVVANVTGGPHGGADDIRRDMVRQVTSSVRWLSCVQWMKQTGISQYLECGPGKVLSGLIKRIDGSAVPHNIQDCATLAKAAQNLKGQIQ